MKLTFHKKSHTEISFCVCLEPKNTSNRALEEKHEIQHSKIFDIFYLNIHFYNFFKDALESQDARKMGLRVCGAAQRGFMTSIVFSLKSACA